MKTAISWLNEHCNIVHNNIHLDSIYVSKDKQSRWILGDFQLASPLKELSKEFLERSKDMRYSETITPEEVRIALFRWCCCIVNIDHFRVCVNFQ